MSKLVGYKDAVALLGGGSPLAKALDRALGGLLLAATGGGSELAISLFDAKTESARLGEQLLLGLRDKIKGYSRYDRTQRLKAAHTIVVVNAFFAALDDINVPFDPAQLRLSAEERARIANTDHAIRSLVDNETPIPVPHLDHSMFVRVLRLWYVATAESLLAFMAGLSVWDRLDHRRRTVAEEQIRTALPEGALRRYESLHRQLVTEVPEFGFWTAELRQREIGTALARIETVLESFASDHTPEDVARTLVLAWRGALHRPILSEGDVPGDLAIPTLADGYVDPDFRVRRVDAAGSPADESWWAEVTPRADLAEFLASHLLTPEGVESPLLVLGQPGAGKSVLTRILAARLDARDFLPVRVVLREVPAEADIQDQIEYAIRAAIGETLTWPALVRAAGPALPVVLLDGFDELLQATGVSHSDYLDKVGAFQRREADLGRPVAMLVTSRTAVADRARPPAGTLSVRLEPFRKPHVQRWLDIWNSANGMALRDRGLAPLDVDLVLRQPDLAGQPLLLMMLALYDADTNALRGAGETLDEGSLYERLLTTFANREVRKTCPSAREDQLRMLVEAELLRLSVAAFGMFNRNRQWVTEQELDLDLRALMPDRRTETPSGFRQPLQPAEKLVGRFFFMQRGEATRDGSRLRTYEFLHATFGEYLIARLTMRLLTELAAEEEAAALSVFGAAGCHDGQLHALLSFAPLTNREPILGFLVDLASHGLPSGVRTLPIMLFKRLDDRAGDRDFRDYAPAKLPPPERYAVYDVNLLLLAVMLNDEVRASALFPDAAEHVLSWRRHALLWQAMLSPTAWSAVVFALQTRACWQADRRDLVVSFDKGAHTPPADPYWLFLAHPGHPMRSFTSWQYTRAEGLARQTNLVRDRVNEVLMHTVESMTGQFAEAATTFVARDADRAVSIAAAIGRFQSAALLRDDADEIRVAGEEAVYAVTRCWAPDAEVGARDRGVRIVLALVELVVDEVPAGLRTRWVTELTSGGPRGG